MLLDERTLVEQARDGDVGAYEELVRRFQDLATRTAFIMTGGEMEAQDVAQEAFVKAYYALPRFRAGEPFRPWLLRIVANEARNRRKATARRAGLALKLAALPAPAVDAATPESETLQAERSAALLAVLNALREEDRQVIALRYFLDLSEAELADVLGCARGTVKSRLSRALARLRRQLGAVAMESGMVPPSWLEAPHERA